MFTSICRISCSAKEIYYDAPAQLIIDRTKKYDTMLKVEEFILALQFHGPCIAFGRLFVTEENAKVEQCSLYYWRHNPHLESSDTPVIVVAVKKVLDNAYVFYRHCEQHANDKLSGSKQEYRPTKDGLTYATTYESFNKCIAHMHYMIGVLTPAQRAEPMQNPLKSRNESKISENDEVQQTNKHKEERQSTTNSLMSVQLPSADIGSQFLDLLINKLEKGKQP